MRFRLSFGIVAFLTLAVCARQTTLAARINDVAQRAPESQHVVLGALVDVAPGTLPAAGVLTRRTNTTRRTQLAYWEGEVKGFRVRAFQSTNESQWHCPPYGTVTDVEVSVRSNGQAHKAQWIDAIGSILRCDRETLTREAGCFSSDASGSYGRVIETEGHLYLQLGCVGSPDVPFTEHTWDDAQTRLLDLFGQAQEPRAPTTK